MDFKTEILAAGALAVGLAIVADALLVLAQRARDAVGDDSEDGMIARRASTSSATRFDFIVDRARVVAREDLGARRSVSVRPWSSRSRIAVPAGVLLGHLHRGSFVAVSVANVGRALPTLVVIGVGYTFLGFGFTNVMVALVVLAVPPILTNAYVAVDEVDPDAVEAARGMGMTPFQVLRRVELPLALPLLFVGIRTAAVFVVASATIAAIAGGGGLGEILVNQAAYDVEGLVGRGALRVPARARRRRGARRRCSAH